MNARTCLFVSALTFLVACDPAEEVRVQELPPLARSSVEARLGLPELRGAWRFAGWELAEGDTLGLDAELPAYGILWLQAQKRDSIGGFYLAGDGRTPLAGEIRRDSTVSLVVFPAPQDGRYLVGRVGRDTLWLEMTTLSDVASWRGDARAAFVRSETALSPFRRVRGMAPPPSPPDSAAHAAADSLTPPPSGAPPRAIADAPPGTGVPRTTPPGGGGQPSVPRVQPPTLRGRAEAPVAGAQPQVEAEGEARRAVGVGETPPQPSPVIERRDPPRLLGVPVDSVDRD